MSYRQEQDQQVLTFFYEISFKYLTGAIISTTCLILQTGISHLGKGSSQIIPSLLGHILNQFFIFLCKAILFPNSNGSHDFSFPISNSDELLCLSFLTTLPKKTPKKPYLWEECDQVIKINKYLSLVFQYVAFSDNSSSPFVFLVSSHFSNIQIALFSLLSFSLQFQLPTFMSFISFSFHAFSASSWKMYLLASHSLPYASHSLLPFLNFLPRILLALKSYLKTNEPWGSS